MAELLEQLVPKVRDHYVEQFRAFVQLQRSTGRRGAAEVKFDLPGDSSNFGGIHCVDYVENDVDGMVAHWLVPDKKLSFERFAELRATASIDVQSLCWDDIKVSFDGLLPDYEPWFDLWFDRAERDYLEGDEFSGKVHSLSPAESDVVVDFGTAPPQALFDLLDAIIAAGSTRLTLSTTR